MNKPPLSIGAAFVICKKVGRVSDFFAYCMLYYGIFANCVYNPFAQLFTISILTENACPYGDGGARGTCVILRFLSGVLCSIFTRGVSCDRFEYPVKATFTVESGCHCDLIVA